MNRLSIRQKLVASFVMVILAVCVMGGFAYTGFINIAGKASDLEAHALQALQYNWQTSAKWEDNYLLTQKLVIQPDEASFDKLKQQLLDNRAAFNQLITEYEGVLTDSLAQQLFTSLKLVRVPYQGVQDEIIKTGVHLRDDPAQSQAIMRLLASHFGMVNNAVNALTKASTKVAAVSIAAMVTSIDNAQLGMAASFVAALLLALLCGVYLMRAITHPLGALTGVMDRMRQGDFTQRINRRDEFGALGQVYNRMADELAALFSQVQTSGIQVDTSLTQIATTAKQQEATASEMAATTTEIGMTSKEISTTSKELATTMNHVSSVAEQTAVLANSGQAGLSRMDKIMLQVVDASQSINDKLAVLNAEAARITQVVATITKIADQTNLLSLNAAIEAQKAGESGRGFAVVASEIRRLADQTAVSTYDIEQMVSKIQLAVAAGVMEMDKFSEEVRRGMDEERRVSAQLSEIIQQVQALPPRIETATDGMRAQVAGAEQITAALLQLTEAAQQSLDSLRQSSHAIEELNQVSGNLKSGVSRFKLAASPGADSHPPTTASGVGGLRRWITRLRQRGPVKEQPALPDAA